MMTVLLLAFAALILAEVSWGVLMLVTGRNGRTPPVHVEDSWSVNGLPTHPYAFNR